MGFMRNRNTVRGFVAGAIALGALATATPASAAPPIAVDFTVSESLPVGTPGDLIVSDVPGCAAPAPASVTTPSATRTDSGPVVRFTGTKVVDCGGGDTFTLSFRASVSACDLTDSGRWKLVDGTGVFEGAKGNGRLVGTYTLGGGAGDFCDNDGIDDRYTGKIKLAG